MTKKWLVIALVMVASVSSSPIAHAGLWNNLWNALSRTVEDYNAGVINTGNSVNAALRDGKVLDAFAAYEQDMMVTCQTTLENTKATYAALKDIVLWLPRQVKKVWDKFVSVLQHIRDSLIALNQPGAITGSGGGAPQPQAAPPADAPGVPSTTSSRASTVGFRSSGFMGNFDLSPYRPTPRDNEETTASPPAHHDAQHMSGMGDAFVDAFQRAPTTRERLATFTDYRGHLHTMQLWMNGLEQDHREALEPNFEKVRSECDLLQQMLFDEISESIEGNGAALEEFISTLTTSNPQDAPVLFGDLATQVKRRINMVRTHSTESASLADAATTLNDAMTKAGIH